MQSTLGYLVRRDPGKGRHLKCMLLYACEKQLTPVTNSNSSAYIASQPLLDACTVVWNIVAVSCGPFTSNERLLWSPRLSVITIEVRRSIRAWQASAPLMIQVYALK